MEVKLPANWDEIITAGKYLEVIRVLNAPVMVSGAEPEHTKFALFHVLTGYDMTAGFADVPLDQTSISELFLAATLMDEVFPILEFITNRTPFYKCPLPVITIELTSYAAPDERLMNQTGQEWSICHHAEHTYRLTGDKKHLLTLMAANYHRMNNDVRSSYNEKEFEQDQKALEALPEETLIGFYLWYQHADEWWVKRFPNLFMADAGGGNTKATGLEVRSIMFELAGNKLDDAWDKVNNRTRQDIIFALEELESKRE